MGKQYTGSMAHIGIDARLTHYRVGGISTYTRQLIQALETLDHPEEYFTVFGSRKATQSVSSRFNEAALWTPPHHRLEPISLSIELMRYRLDIFHATDFIPPLWGARHHIITIHDLTFLHYPDHKDRAARRYYNGQISSAVRRADHILAVSQATGDDLITMLDVSPEKITVQPHGVGPHYRPLQSHECETARKRLHLPESYFLFVGTLEPRKNIPALLAAYEMLHAARRDIPALVLVGQIGWLFEDTLAHIQHMQTRGLAVILRHDIADADLPAVYSLARALILPAFYEGFGLPALEAMACGTVPIVSNRSSLPEIVGDVGLQVNPDDPSGLRDALDKVVNELDWAAKMEQAGLMRARAFTWERSARIALTVYRAYTS